MENEKVKMKNGKRKMNTKKEKGNIKECKIREEQNTRLEKKKMKITMKMTAKDL